MKYYLIAGEASGDLHASALMRALKEEDKDAEFRFFGGDLMAAQGGALVKHYREMAYMGFVQVFLNLNKVFENLALCRKDITRWHPDVLILIDYPSFNLKIAKYVKEMLGIPVFYYISPKIWAWKEYRIKSIKRYVDKMYSILPFEVPFYKNHGYKIDYVGNPTVDEISERPFADETFDAFILGNNLPDKPVIALLAGSRRAEIAENLPKMIEAASSFPDFQMIVAGAPGIEPEYYNQFTEGKNVSVVFNSTFRLLQQASAALVTSGTATLETALFNVPQVVCYHMGGGKFTYRLFKRILHVRFVSLVNLIADEEIVPELLVHLFTVENVRKELGKILYEGEGRRKMLLGYRLVAEKLGKPGAPANAARMMVETLTNYKH
ncbi:lipid-A-disaccharide synthase [Coprobacter tertius]|uniref:Lipid-A-disaccharide synthase n=1 Tax=Coprobacter tertius TaxID=2944915 RepID=A0ABT1MI90_9BACT|nr:lipid-A-disaccharide synthase [Coprobacter tertius]MCP9612348.1 lipid-A-disaccharide synthase [Coprobacter tertius]